MEWVEPIALVLGVVCVALAAMRNVWTFPTAIGSVSLVGFVVFRERLFSDALLQGFFIAANLYGWINWSRDRAAAGEIVVETMSPRARWNWGAGCVVATILWGSLMHAVDASYPWWDAGIAAVSMAAQILMAHRKWENWVLWIAVDIAAIPLYLAKGLDLLALLYVIYLGLAVWGAIDWARAQRTAGPAVVA